MGSLSLIIAMGERLFHNVSITSAELSAIIMALEHLVNNQPLSPNTKNIIVYSNSCVYSGPDAN